MAYRVRTVRTSEEYRQGVGAIGHYFGWDEDELAARGLEGRNHLQSALSKPPPPYLVSGSSLSLPLMKKLFLLSLFASFCAAVPVHAASRGDSIEKIESCEAILQEFMADPAAMVSARIAPCV